MDYPDDMTQVLTATGRKMRIRRTKRELVVVTGGYAVEVHEGGAVRTVWTGPDRYEARREFRAALRRARSVGHVTAVALVGITPPGKPRVLKFVAVRAAKPRNSGNPEPRPGVS